MKFSANSVWENKDKYDVVVIGAGHAGCEAALACARLGFQTVVFTVSVDSIALMPCNPNIGGSSKGHLVRELDALGGEMGKVIDRTFIQSKMLNKSKGPAVHSLRAQADKANYSRTMRRVLENQERLAVPDSESAELAHQRHMGFRIFFPYFDQIVEVSRHEMHFLDFRQRRDLFPDSHFSQFLVRMDFDEASHSQTERAGINLRFISGDDVFLLHPLNPFQDGGRGEFDFSCNFRIGHSGILLKQAQNRLVCFIKHDSSLNLIYFRTIFCFYFF